MYCHGCGEQIKEGQHILRLTVRTDTRMPEGWRPVRAVEPVIQEVILDTPACFERWAAGNPIIVDVFAH